VLQLEDVVWFLQVSRQIDEGTCPLVTMKNGIDFIAAMRLGPYPLHHYNLHHLHVLSASSCRHRSSPTKPRKPRCKLSFGRYRGYLRFMQKTALCGRHQSLGSWYVYLREVPSFEMTLVPSLVKIGLGFVSIRTTDTMQDIQLNCLHMLTHTRFLIHELATRLFEAGAHTRSSLSQHGPTAEDSLQVRSAKDRSPKSPTTNDSSP
jgi:hypothetical protein